MRSVILFVPLMCLIGCRTGPVDRASDEADIRALVASMESANNEGNVDLWVEGFDEPAWYLPPFGEAVTSRDGLREVAARGFAGWQTTISIEPRSIRVSGDWADVYSEVRGHAVSRSSNDSVAVNVKQLVVYRRTPDGWKISRLMINPNE